MTVFIYVLVAVFWSFAVFYLGTCIGHEYASDKQKEVANKLLSFDSVDCEFQVVVEVMENEPKATLFFQGKKLYTFLPTDRRWNGDQ